MAMNSHGAVHLLLTFALVALLPLCWVWVSREPDKFRKLAWVALFLTFDLIVFGAFTRLTDSGLGCPDWPGCYGHANPLQAQSHIDAAAAAMPDGPVTRSKAWIEMIHRYLAGAIGVLCIALLVSALRMGRKGGQLRKPACEPRLPLMLVLCVCVQGAFGAFTVTLKLQPLIVSMHLLLGLTLLILMARLAVRQVPAPALDAESRARLRPWLWGAMLFLFCQIALGAWVSTNYATLACSEFPLCQGQWVPDMDFRHGFSLWRQLGKTSGGDFLPFPALTAIHWVHRSFAWLAALMLVLLWWQVRRVTAVALAGGGQVAVQAAAGMRKLAGRLIYVLLLQLLTGLSTIFFSFPLAIAVLHNAGAALLVLLLTMLHYRATTKTAEN